MFVAYEIAPVAGGGGAIVRFGDTIHVEETPVNVEGLREAPYPVNAWAMTEIEGHPLGERFPSSKPRIWSISFNDVTMLVAFRDVALIAETRESVSPAAALLAFPG